MPNGEHGRVLAFLLLRRAVRMQHMPEEDIQLDVVPLVLALVLVHRLAAMVMAVDAAAAAGLDSVVHTDDDRLVLFLVVVVVVVEVLSLHGLALLLLLLVHGRRHQGRRGGGEEQREGGGEMHGGVSRSPRVRCVDVKFHQSTKQALTRFTRTQIQIHDKQKV
ncbi:hypothetical protein PG987_016533 [Apiospora arundinis]